LADDKVSDFREASLRALLPPSDSAYDFDTLNQSETAALEAALGDGFGDVDAAGYRSEPLPLGIRSGLLRHRFFVSGRSEYAHEEYSEEFWDWRDDRPPPSEDFPLGFVVRKLHLYFANQLDRFCEQVLKNEPAYEALERDQLEAMAAERLYEKPWYEFHAVRFIDWMQPEKGDTGKYKTLPFLFASSWSGKLGRLVEQYYWRFRFEKAAITGFGSRAGASTGGKAKARSHDAEQAVWQRLAKGVWASNPKLTKAAVAKIIKVRLRAPQTTKHIARFIKRAN
jgi:hypothetical protein